MAPVTLADRSTPDGQLEKARRLVSDGMLGDWVVRIEHTDRSARGDSLWRQWEAPLFALRDAEPVIGAINRCRARHPGQAVRLNACRLNPETRLVYWVIAADQRRDGTNRAPAATGLRLSLHQRLARVRATRLTILHWTLLTGVLLGSLALAAG